MKAIQPNVFNIPSALVLCLLFVIQSATAQVNLSQGLMAHYSFLGNANDLSGNNNHGTLYGPTLCNDKNGNPNSAYYFDGINDYIQVANSPTINFPNNTFSYCALIKVQGFYNGPCHGNIVIDKGNADYIAGSYSLRFSDGYSLNFLNCNSPVTVTQQNYYPQFNTISFASGAYTPYIDTSVWDCIVVTGDGTNIKLYINGQLKQNLPMTSNLGVNAHDMFFGRKNSAQYPYWFKGIMDEIRIYNRALNVQEIDALCNCSIPLNAPPVAPICIGQSTQLLATGAQSYVWTPATGLSNPNIANPIANPTVTTTYTITASNGNNCNASTTLTVIVNPIPVVTVNPANPSICAGGSVSLNALGANTFSWSPSGSLSSGTGNTVQAFPTATTMYTVTGSNGNNCSATTSVVVVVHATPTLTIAPSNPTICAGTSVNLSVVGASTYVWSPTTGLSPATGSWVLAYLNATTTYTVTGTDAYNCTATSTVTVNVNPKPTISTSPINPSVCNGSSIQLEAFGASSFVWSPTIGLSAGTGAVVQASPNATTTYTVTGTDANSCTGTTTINVIVKPLPNVFIQGNNSSVCLQDSVMLNAYGANSYVWQPAQVVYPTTGNTVDAFPSVNTVYTVTGTDVQGCTSSNTYLVSIVDFFDLKVVKNRDIECGFPTAQLFATGADQYSWWPTVGLSNPNIASPIVDVAQTTTYYVTGTLGSCNRTDSITVNVYNNNADELFIPNAFSPNGDGKNDCVKPLHKAHVLRYFFTIYNRYGNCVFSTYDMDECWNGQQKGRDADVGTYFYYMKATTPCGELFKKGDILLLR